MATLKRWNGTAWEYVNYPTNLVTTDTAQTISGVKTFTAAPVLPASSISLASLNATGTRDATTFLRGDGTWQVVSGAAPSNMVTTDTVQVVTAKTFRATSVPILALDTGVGGTGTASISIGRSSATVDLWYGVVGTANFLSDNAVGDTAFRVNNTTNALRIGFGTSNAAATTFTFSSTGLTSTQPITVQGNNLTALAVAGNAGNTGSIASAWARVTGSTDAWMGVVGTTKFFLNDTAGDFAIRANSATGAVNIGYGTGSTANVLLKVSSAGVAVNQVVAGSTALSVTGTGGRGAEISLLDATAAQTTPNKYIRSRGGNLEVVNSGYTATILYLNDNGGLATTTGYFTGAISSEHGPGANAGTGQALRLSTIFTSDMQISAFGTPADINIYYNTKGIGSHVFNAKIQNNGTIQGATLTATGASGVIDNGNRVFSLSNKVTIAGINATGTADATTYLRGDGTWATVAGGGASLGANTFTGDQTISKTTPKITLTDGTTTHYIGIATAAGQIDVNAGVGDLVIGSPGNVKNIWIAATLTGLANINMAGSVSGLGGIYDNGVRVFSSNNLPSAANITSGTFPGAMTFPSAVVTGRTDLNTSAIGVGSPATGTFIGGRGTVTSGTNFTVLAHNMTDTGGTKTALTTAGAAWLSIGNAQVDIWSAPSVTAGSAYTSVQMFGVSPTLGVFTGSGYDFTVTQATLLLSDDASPTTPVSNQVAIYSSSGRGKIKDAAGNVWNLDSSQLQRLSATIANSTTSGISSGLSMTLQPGTYAIEINGGYTAAAATTGLRAYLSNSSGTVTSINYGGFISTSATANTNFWATAMNTVVGNATASAGATALPFQFTGTVVFSVAGTLLFGFASGVASSAVTLQIGTYMRVTRIA